MPVRRSGQSRHPTNEQPIKTTGSTFFTSGVAQHTVAPFTRSTCVFRHFFFFSVFLPVRPYHWPCYWPTRKRGGPPHRRTGPVRPPPSRDSCPTRKRRRSLPRGLWRCLRGHRDVQKNNLFIYIYIPLGSPSSPYLWYFGWGGALSEDDEARSKQKPPHCCVCRLSTYR